MLLLTDDTRHTTVLPGMSITDCDRCKDLGIWITPQGRVAVCPNIEMGNRHVEPSEAAQAVKRATDRLQRNGGTVHQLSFDVARKLSYFTSEQPCDRDSLLNSHFGWTSNNRLRRFHKVIEELRSDWLLPVASRKEDPAGYWISVDLDDFSEWVQRSKSAPITQLGTIYKLARATWPAFAEQIELEFWKDLAPEHEEL